MTGPARRSAQALVADPDVDGLTFTGSYEVGHGDLPALRDRTTRSRSICEMGGKNPVIVVGQRRPRHGGGRGTPRSAFGLQGQKCSAASRVYVERAGLRATSSPQLVEQAAR